MFSVARSETFEIAAGTVNVAFTDRGDGDFAVASSPAELDGRRRRIVDKPWTWLRQVHGADIVSVKRPGQWAGCEADGAITSAAGCPLAIMSADCAPVVLVSDGGVAVVHAGWRGLASGVIEKAAAGLHSLGGAPRLSLIGPCINAASYEFGRQDLVRLVEMYGPDVEAETTWGTPSLDVPATVAAACRGADWPVPTQPPPCTSDERWYSHRTRSEPGRQATVAWIEPTPDHGARP